MASNRELSALGRTLAAVQDDLLQCREQPALSVRIAAIYQARARRQRSRQRWSRLGYGVGAAVVAAAIMLLLLRPRALEFQINGEHAVGRMGVLIAAPAAGARSIGFSDGSRIQLRGGAEARVVSSSEHGARVVIERGVMRADVVPRPKNDWSVFGGPFEIRVTGTSFDSGWDPERQQLFVSMHEGHVLISAECLSEARALSAGQTATFSCLPEPSPAPPQTVIETVPSPARVAPASAALLRQQGAAGQVPLAPTPRAEPRASGWHELGASGDYPGALAAAEREGFERLCEALSTAELLELASTARLAGNSARAKVGYAAVRRRFAGSESAASAAFHLGQLAFDEAHDYPGARRFFATYLSECQSCNLAPEALGRRMEAEQRSGDAALARESARQYLDRFPKGAHARLAQSLISP